MTSATFASAGAVAAKSIDVLIVGERVAAVLSVLLLIWEKVKFLLLNCLTCSLGFFNAKGITKTSVPLLSLLLGNPKSVSDKLAEKKPSFQQANLHRAHSDVRWGVDWEGS
jgi:hypothetical protein